MGANHSPLQFFDPKLVATVLPSGDEESRPLTGTMARPTESNGASPASVSIGTSSACETEPRSLVQETPTVVDSGRGSRALRSGVTGATTPGGLLTLSGDPATVPSASPPSAARTAPTHASVSAPSVTLLVATHAIATYPVATASVATNPVATRSLRPRSAPRPAGNRDRSLQVQASLTHPPAATRRTRT
jgi:hypothetical protein